MGARRTSAKAVAEGSRMILRSRRAPDLGQSPMVAVFRLATKANGKRWFAGNQAATVLQHTEGDAFNPPRPSSARITTAAGRHPCGKEGLYLRRRQGLAVIVALRLIAALLAQKSKLFSRLNAFGNGSQTEAA